MVYMSIVSVIAIGGSNTVTYGISLLYICLGLYCNLDVVSLLITNPSGVNPVREDLQYV